MNTRSSTKGKLPLKVEAVVQDIKETQAQPIPVIRLLLSSGHADRALYTLSPNFEVPRMDLRARGKAAQLFGFLTRPPMVHHPREQRGGRSVGRRERGRRAFGRPTCRSLGERANGGDGGDDDGDDGGSVVAAAGDAIPEWLKDRSWFPTRNKSYLHGGAPKKSPSNG